MDALYHTDETPEQPHKRRRKTFPPAKPGYKYCYDCELEKPLEQFPVTNGKAFSYCHDCVNARNKARKQTYVKERRYTPRKPIADIFTRDGYKMCPACEKELPLEAFPFRKGKYVGSCKECERTRDRERNKWRYKSTNPIEAAVIPSPEVSRPTKRCSTCGKTKFLHSDFSQLKSSPDRRNSECMECKAQKREAKKQVPLGFKRCPGCEVIKSLEENFYKHPSHGRYIRYCNDCNKKRREQHYIENIDNHKKYAQERQSNPTYVEYHRQKERERYNTIPTVAQKARESVKRYRKENPLKKREFNSRREARKKGNKVGRVSYKRILERDGYWCYICEKDIDPAIKKGNARLVFDHVIPLVPRPDEPQGTHSADNIRPAHHICNSRKKNKPFHLLTSFDRQGLM